VNPEWPKVVLERLKEPFSEIENSNNMEVDTAEPEVIENNEPINGNCNLIFNLKILSK